MTRRNAPYRLRSLRGVLLAFLAATAVSGCDDEGGDALPSASKPAPAASSAGSAAPAAAQPAADQPTAAQPVPPPAPSGAPGSATAPGPDYTMQAFAHMTATVAAQAITTMPPASAVEVEPWRELARERLIASLGVRHVTLDELPLRPFVHRSTEREGFRLDEISYFVEDGLRASAYLLVPSGATDSAAVVFWHGHGNGAAGAPVGLLPDGTANDHGAGALDLVRAGYVVLVPTIRTFEPGSGLLEHLRFDRVVRLGGRTSIGVYASDALRAIDLLRSMPEVAADRIGVTGLSLGGAVTLLSFALDDRVRSAVVQGYFGSYRGSLLHLGHCPCQHAGALGHELDLADIAALGAPRSLRVVSGARDPEFPIAEQRAAFAQTAAVYALLEADDRVSHVVVDAEHVWIAEPALEFFGATLADPPADD